VSLQPWEQVDCQLTAADVAALVQRRAAHLRLAPPRYIDEGWSSWAYGAADESGEEWILRFPKREMVARQLKTEIRMLPMLRERLPLPIPRFLLVAEPDGAAYPHTFVGYRRLEGVPGLECLDAPFDPGALGQDIGRFLAALHGAPAEWTAGFRLDLPGADAGDGASVRAAEEQFEEFGSAASPEAVATARSVLRRPAAAGEAPVLLHNDFFPEHVLVADGRAAGVIDWGDLSCGDPAGDLAGLYYWRGETLLAAGLEAYGAARGLAAAELDRIAARARFVCVLRAGDDLEYGVEGRRPDYLRMAVQFLERLAGEL
jgi:aminoglycoside phosphotransferase (APT) family kinase protein